MKVYFTNDSAINPEDEGIRVYLSKSDDLWNDFGSRTIFSIKIFRDKLLIYEKKAFNKILFRNDNSELLATQKPLLNVNDIQEEFISQVHDQEGYQDLYKILKLKTSIKMLQKINDLGVLTSIDDSAATYFFRGVNPETLNETLLRESEPFLLHNGSKALFLIADTKDPPKIEVSFQLNSFSNMHEIDLNFEKNPISRNRVNILVGKNGVGKSQALKNICIGEINKILSLTSKQVANVFNMVVAISNVADDSFPEVKDLPEFGGIFYRYLNLVKKETKRSLTASLVNVIRDTNLINRKESKYDLLKRSLSEIIIINDILIPLGEKTPIKHKFFSGKPYISCNEFWKTSEKGRVHLIAHIDYTQEPLVIGEGDHTVQVLSTGQKFFFNLAIQVLGFTQHRSLLLFEEPETYLHPNLEVDFFKLINEIIKSTSSYAVFSTHSIFLVRELMSSQVKIIAKNNDIVEIFSPSIQTFGASLDSISDYIFGDLDKNKNFETLLKNLKMDKEQAVKELSKYLGESAIFYLLNKNNEEDK